MMELFHDLLQPEMFFLRCALLIGLFSSVALGIIGTTVVTRRISSIAGAIAHASLGGVGIAFFLQRILHWSWCSPTICAVIASVISALLVGCFRIYAKEREDTIINVVWALGMSVGLLFLDKTPGYSGDWQVYIFGNILLLTQTEVWLTLLLDLFVVIPTLFFYNNLLAMSFDETFAELRGVRTKLIFLTLLTLTALTIVLLINVVGIILVIALLTLPAATAGCFTRHLWSMMMVASVLSWLFVTAGLIFSYWYNLPSGPLIVVIAVVVYVLGLCVSAWSGRRS